MQDTVQQSSREMTAAEELSVISDKTDIEGNVEVSLDEWEKQDDNTVRVWFWTPTGERVHEDMRWPEAGEVISEYKFVRLLKDAGLSLNMPDFEHAGNVKACKNGDSWNLKVSEYDAHHFHDAGLLERGKSKIKSSVGVLDAYIENTDEPDDVPSTLPSIFILSLFAPLFIFIGAFETIDERDEGAVLYISGILGAVLWTLLAVILSSPIL